MTGQHYEWKMPNLVILSTLLRLKARNREQWWRQSRGDRIIDGPGLPLFQVCIHWHLRCVLFLNRVVSGILISHLRRWSSEAFTCFTADAKVSPSSHSRLWTVAQSRCPEGGPSQSQLRERGPLQDQSMESIWRGNEEWQETRCTQGLGQKVLEGWQEHQLPGNRVAVFLACDGIDPGRCPVKANPHQVKCSRSWDSNSSRSQGLLLSCQNPG